MAQRAALMWLTLLRFVPGLIDELIQVPYYAEFARYNTYGIQAINQSVYDFMNFAYYTPLGCRDLIEFCVISDKRTIAGQELCREADFVCRLLVEQQYYNFGGRGQYLSLHGIAINNINFVRFRCI